MKRYLTEHIDEAFRLHIETDNGLICGPDRLKERLKKAVAAWIKAEEDDYRKHDCEETADVLCDLRENLIDG
jgi:hypothetical protein